MRYADEQLLVSEELYDGHNRLLAKANHDKNVIGEVEVIYRTKKDGKTIFTRTIGHNDLLVTGSVYMQEKINGFRSKFVTTPVDVELGIHNASEVDQSNTQIPNEIICGAMIGNAGTSDTYNTVRKVRRANRMVPGAFPWRVVPATADLSGTERAKYFMRRVRGEYVYYYGKRFDSDPIITVVYEDGTVVPTNVGDLTDDSKFIRVYTTYRFTAGKNDVREYFKVTQGSTMNSLINSVGLITGYSGMTTSGQVEFYNVRGLTTMNMENQDLKDSESTITFIYRLFIQ